MPALAPVSVIDTFSRNVSDDWGTTDSGCAWGGEGSTAYDVNGTDGTISVAANAGYRTTYLAIDGVGIGDQESSEILIETKWTGSATYPRTDYGPILNRTSSGTFYFATLQGNYGEIAIGAYINGTRWELDRTSLAINKNTYYWVRFQKTSSGLRVKVWKRDTAEPTGWSLETDLWDGVDPPQAGKPGIFHKGTPDSYTISVDTAYYYTFEDESPYLPVEDLFARSSHEGFSVNSAGHVWRGNVSVDPNVTLAERRGSVGGGMGTITLSDTQTIYGFLGPDTSQDFMEAYFEWQTNTASATLPVIFYFGLYGNMEIVDGVVKGYGYALRAQGASTTVQWYKKTSADGAWTAFGSTATLGSFPASTLLKLRLQIEGTSLRARWWIGSNSEPGTWTLTSTDSTSRPPLNGRLWFAVQNQNDSAPTRNFEIDTARYNTYTPSAGTNYTTVGSASITTQTDTSLAARFAYTNDSDGNNSIVIKYRKSTNTTWTTIGSTVNRTSKWFTSDTVNNLEPATTYIFQATFSDNGGIVGTNPITIQATTPQLRATIGELTASNITSTSADLTLGYVGDTDNDSTAQLHMRTLGSAVEVINDTFNDVTNTLLQDHVSNSGATWFRHTNGSSDGDVYIYRNRPYYKANMGDAVAVYYTSTVPSSADYAVSTDVILDSSYWGGVNVVGRCDPVNNTYYYGGYLAGSKGEGGRWRIGKLDGGVASILYISAAEQLEFDIFYNIELYMEGSLLRLNINGERVAEVTDSAISAAGRAGFRFTSSTGLTYPTTPTDMARPDNFKMTTRSSVGSWVVAGAGTMTANRPAKTFALSVGSLSQDTLYEFRGTLADPDGIVGVTTATTTVQTVGNKVKFADVPIQSIAYPTSATIIVSYLYDNDNDSSLTAQYKAVKDNMWTTIPTSFIVKDSGSKQFRFTPTGLKAATTYEVRVTLTDPDGIIEGSSDTASGNFTTKARERIEQSINKRYVWKVYKNDTQEYMETWHDAGAPEFSWEENGGVSDLTVRLNRPISALNNPDTSIAYFNRVDVWVHDTYESGMGPNIILDENISFGSWTLGTDTVINGSGGVDGGKCLRINTATASVKKSYSEAIYIDPSPNIVGDDFRNRTFIISGYARARRGKLVLSVEEYRDVESVSSLLAVGDETIDTVGTEWQLLRIRHKIVDPRTEYIRIVVYNDGAGDMRFDTPSIRTEEVLLYSGHIEQISPYLSSESEYIDVQVLGDAARLSDTYVEWLQYVTTQGSNDFIVDASLAAPNNKIYRENRGPDDPSEMLKDLIDLTNTDNPKSRIYATTTSVKNTLTDPLEYTFRDVQVRAAFDKVRELCPAGWHYFIEPDGLVWLRGPQHARTHILRIGVEATKFEADFTIRNLKNYVKLKGRQDEDFSEADGYGSIESLAFDQANIDKYGKRQFFMRDAKVANPDTADTITAGKLEELNRPEQRSRLTVIDEKTIIDNELGFRGYNIESFRPGDFVVVLNPKAAPEYTYWDQGVWDQDFWNSTTNIRVLTEPVPIKTIQYHDTFVVLQLSERAPSSVSDFGRMLRILQKQQADGNE